MRYIRALPTIYGKYLFVGNAVSKFSQELGFYYLNSRNLFWSLLDEMFFNGEETFTKLKKEYINNRNNRENIKIEFIKMLKNEQIGLVDVIQSCEISEGSLDKNIAIDTIEFNEELICATERASIVFINGKGKTYHNFKFALGEGFNRIENKIVILPSSSSAASVKNKKDIWKNAISKSIL